VLAGLSLFYVGAVLCLNGFWLLGRIRDKEIAVIHIFVGGITLLVALNLAFGPGADLASIKGGCAFASVHIHLLLGCVESIQRRRRSRIGLVLLVRRQQVFPINKSVVALNLLTNLRFVLQEH
jgi:hypothetical protein